MTILNDSRVSNTDKKDLYYVPIGTWFEGTIGNYSDNVWLRVRNAVVAFAEVGEDVVTGDIVFEVLPNTSLVVSNYKEIKKVTITLEN